MAEHFAPEVHIDAIRDYELSQYANAEKMNALLDAFVTIMQTSVVDVLETLNRAMNPDEVDGVFLDRLGIRLGMTRPRVQDNTREFWGLEGTRDNYGRPLSQAPFWTEDPTAIVYAPIGNSVFRSILFARARKLHGDMGIEAWEDCFTALTRVSGSMEITNIQDFQVTITIEDLSPGMDQVMRMRSIAEKFLPMSSGVNYLLRFKRVTAGNLGLSLDTGRPTGSLTSSP